MPIPTLKWETHKIKIKKSGDSGKTNELKISLPKAYDIPTHRTWWLEWKLEYQGQKFSGESGYIQKNGAVNFNDKIHFSSPDKDLSKAVIRLTLHKKLHFIINRESSFTEIPLSGVESGEEKTGKVYFDYKGEKFGLDYAISLAHAIGDHTEIKTCVLVNKIPPFNPSKNYGDEQHKTAPAPAKQPAPAPANPVQPDKDLNKSTSFTKKTPFVIMSNKQYQQFKAMVSKKSNLLDQLTIEEVYNFETNTRSVDF